MSASTIHYLSDSGDEKGGDGSYEPFAYVLRPYWFQKIYTTQTNDTPVLWIPNGYSHGVGPRLSSTLLPYSQRPQLCYFEGSVRDNGQPSSREKMRLALSEWDPKHETCDVHWTSGFMQGRNPLVYSATLGRTKYALCPAGDNAETIRYARVFIFYFWSYQKLIVFSFYEVCLIEMTSSRTNTSKFSGTRK
jgi:hypothetical protein